LPLAEDGITAPYREEPNILIESHRIRIDPGSEPAHLLDEVGETSILLERDGELYRLTKEEDGWVGYDAEKVKAAICNTTGSWADIDADTFIADLYRAREEGSRPANRP
jgi:hypothetical protein